MERTVELNPRLYLGCVAEAKKRRVTVREAAGRMLCGWLEAEAELQVREKTRDEAREYKELVERNEVAKRALVQWEEADRLAKALGKGKSGF